jgi:hypothetical protein
MKMVVYLSRSTAWLVIVVVIGLGQRQKPITITTTLTITKSAENSIFGTVHLHANIRLLEEYDVY